MNKFLCFIGFHKWRYANGGKQRKCTCCPKSQRIDEHLARDWAEVNWIDE